MDKEREETSDRTLLERIKELPEFLRNRVLGQDRKTVRGLTERHLRFLDFMERELGGEPLHQKTLLMWIGVRTQQYIGWMNDVGLPEYSFDALVVPKLGEVRSEFRKYGLTQEEAQNLYSDLQLSPAVEQAIQSDGVIIGTKTFLAGGIEQPKVMCLSDLKGMLKSE